MDSVQETSFSLFVLKLTHVACDRNKHSGTRVKQEGLNARKRYSLMKVTWVLVRHLLGVKIRFWYL